MKAIYYIIISTNILFVSSIFAQSKDGFGINASIGYYKDFGIGKTSINSCKSFSFMQNLNNKLELEYNFVVGKYLYNQDGFVGFNSKLTTYNNSLILNRKLVSIKRFELQAGFGVNYAYFDIKTPIIQTDFFVINYQLIKEQKQLQRQIHYTTLSFPIQVCLSVKIRSHLYARVQAGFYFIPDVGYDFGYGSHLNLGVTFKPKV